MEARLARVVEANQQDTQTSGDENETDIGSQKQPLDNQDKATLHDTLTQAHQILHSRRLLALPRASLKPLVSRAVELTIAALLVAHEPIVDCYTVERRGASGLTRREAAHQSRQLLPERAN